MAKSAFGSARIWEDLRREVGERHHFPSGSNPGHVHMLKAVLPQLLPYMTVDMPDANLSIACSFLIWTIIFIVRRQESWKESWT